MCAILLSVVPKIQRTGAIAMNIRKMIEDVKGQIAVMEEPW